MPLSKILNDGISANQSLSLIRVLETANLSSVAPSGNVNIDVSNNTVHFFGANTTANVTFNLRANSTATFDSAIQTGQTVSVAIAVKSGATRHSANLYIDGGLITGSTVLTSQAGSFLGNNIIYAGNTRPALYSLATSVPEVNLYTYTVFKTAANQYTVIASNTIFGIG
jgi:hypothetical protein